MNYSINDGQETSLLMKKDLIRDGFFISAIKGVTSEAEVNYWYKAEDIYGMYETYPEDAPQEGQVTILFGVKQHENQ